jgi:hypothetical protein
VRLVDPQTPGAPAPNHEPIAIFNPDSEAELFQAHLFAGGRVEIDEGVQELLEVSGRAQERERGPCDDCGFVGPRRVVGHHGRMKVVCTDRGACSRRCP